MPYVLLLAALVILGAVVAVAAGYGGELRVFDRDVPAARFRLRTAADVAALRLPIGLFGFQEQATSDALGDIADLIASQEAEIASLREELWRLGAPVPSGAVPSGAVPSGAVPSSSVPVEPSGGDADRDGVPDQPPSAS